MRQVHFFPPNQIKEKSISFIDWKKQSKFLRKPVILRNDNKYSLIKFKRKKPIKYLFLKHLAKKKQRLIDFFS